MSAPCPTPPLPPAGSPYGAWAEVSPVAAWFARVAGSSPVVESVRLHGEAVEVGRAFVRLGSPTTLRLDAVTDAPRALHAPPPVSEALARLLPDAATIFVGHRGGDRGTAKVYLEASGDGPCTKPGWDGARLVGIKWGLAGGDVWGCDRYVPFDDSDDTVGTVGTAGLREAIETLAAVGLEPDASTGFVVHGVGRESIDVAPTTPWPLVECAASIEELRRRFGAGRPPSWRAAPLDRYRTAMLGRIALGHNAEGRFLTLYLTPD